MHPHPLRMIRHVISCAAPRACSEKLVLSECLAHGLRTMVGSEYVLFARKRQHATNHLRSLVRAQASAYAPLTKVDQSSTHQPLPCTRCCEENQTKKNKSNGMLSVISHFYSRRCFCPCYSQILSRSYLIYVCSAFNEPCPAANTSQTLRVGRYAARRPVQEQNQKELLDSDMEKTQTRYRNAQLCCGDLSALAAFFGLPVLRF